MRDDHLNRIAAAASTKQFKARAVGNAEGCHPFIVWALHGALASLSRCSAIIGDFARVTFEIGPCRHLLGMGLHPLRPRALSRIHDFVQVKLRMYFWFAL